MKFSQLCTNSVCVRVYAYAITVVLLAGVVGPTNASRGQGPPPGVPPQKYQEYQPPSPAAAATGTNGQTGGYQQQQQPQAVDTGSNVAAAAERAKELPPRGGHAQAHAQAHAHGHENLLDARDVPGEREHLSEHMPVPIDTSQMTPAELQFHHFKMLDVDGNGWVDGVELQKQLQHQHHGTRDGAGAGATEEGHEVRIYTDEELASIVDMVLATHDKNNDGYISYAGFVQAQG